MAKVIGIDLGTTNSVVAVLENGRPEVIPNAEGGKTTPSVVLFQKNDEIIVGELAKRQRITEPDRVVYSAKRFMGCRWDEAVERMQGISYQTFQDADGMVAIRMGKRRLRPEDVSARVLQKMKESAEAYLGQRVEQAIITVPAHFNDTQRQATKIAGEKAGLTVMRIVNEPTAAALAYGLDKMDKAQKVAVFDFGGGTFDISILEIDHDIMEVKSTGGDTYLGGDNINQILVEWINARILEETGIDPTTDIQALQRIVEGAEKVKCELSTLPKTLISLPFIVANETGPKHFNGEITRPEFVAMISPILDRLRPPCQTALADARLRPRDLAAVILVGGSTRIPAVRDLVKQIFGREPDTSMNPDEVVAQGAAVQAGVMSGELEEVLLLDVTPLSLGIELAGNIFSPLIPRNSNVPATVAKRFTTVVDNQTTVNIHVLQGERIIANENRTLANFKLTGIPPSPKEIPEIQVSFHIDANGILTVTAMDLTSGSTQRIEVESYIPSAPEAAALVAGEEGQAEKEKEFLAKADVRSRLQQLESEFDGMRQSKEAAEFLTEELETRIRESLFRWEIALAQDDWDMIEEAERNTRTVHNEVVALYGLALASQGVPRTDQPEDIRDAIASVIQEQLSASREEDKS